MKARVLVVDDMEDWRDLMAGVLQAHYHVDKAGSLREALALLQHQGPYNAVVTDIRLSETEPHNEDGLQLLRAVHVLSPGTRMIAVSSLRSSVKQEDLERFQQEYHTLVYLPRDVLFEDLPSLVGWVDRAVADSRVAERR